ncbi:MAG TPA: CocE/NonD family hydrolase, partial [Chthonomonadaceae bacterium]|nr:CocE/NonD family hydrolase [Chthonomonadaceae bacterium]
VSMVRVAALRAAVRCVLAALAILPLARPGSAQTGEYSVYSNGVRKGWSRYIADGRGRIAFEGDSGFGSASKGVIVVDAGAALSAEIEVTGAGAVKAAYVRAGGEMRRIGPDGESVSPAVAGASFYYPFQPILLQSLLRGAACSPGRVQPLRAIDLLTGRPRAITAQFVRTIAARVGGRVVRVRQWRLETPPTAEAVVETDENNRPLFWWVPARQFEMALNGFESLRPAAAYEPSVLKPEFGVTVLRDAWIPMRDGVRLQADIYLPSPGLAHSAADSGASAGEASHATGSDGRSRRAASGGSGPNALPAGQAPPVGPGSVTGSPPGSVASGPPSIGRYPVLLQRTCYDRSEFGLSDGVFFAQRGYVYVTQHVRGRGGSEGEFSPFTQEAADGHDSVEWCARQPWSNGRVGMLGASYNGYCEWMAAGTHPRGLTTMISTVPMPGPPDGAPWFRGAFFVGQMLGWYGLLRDKAQTRPFNDDLASAENTLPISDSDKALFGAHIPSFQQSIQADRLDASVRAGGYRETLRTIDLPVLHVSGWLDSVGIGTRLNYTQMVANGRRGQKLVMGPWDHFTNRESRVGAWDFGIDAYLDLKMLYLRWFDRYLKEMRNGIDREPPVSTYLLGENRWERSAVWPPRNIRQERLYLRGSAESGRSAAGHRGALYAQLAQIERRGGNRGIVAAPPTATGRAGSRGGVRAARDCPDHYVYDPAKAVYGPNNQLSFFFAMLGGLDARSLCSPASGDRLVYDSAPLAKPMRLSGPISGTLNAASSAVDTDWAMALLDVSPSGLAVPIGCGFVRARFRDSLADPKPLQPGRPVRYTIDMWQAGVSIPRGHRLRVVVLSTLFPDLDRNLNTGESIANGTRMAVARQTIYHDAAHPSYITLPLIPARGKT